MGWKRDLVLRVMKSKKNVLIGLLNESDRQELFINITSINIY